MILKSLALLAILVVAILIFAATKPDTFHIQRSLTIQASPEKIFPLLNNLHNWPAWAPQDKEDSTIKRTFSGADSGVGAVSDWSGSGNTGKGRMTITESIPAKSVTIQVDWAKPFATRNMNQFVLEPNGTSTQVTWSMTGPNLAVMKLMSVFTNMDRMMGEHFETGLANLKAAAER
jgi:uncharacterized protein YndB with AHSA1/START domain